MTTHPHCPLDAPSARPLTRRQALLAASATALAHAAHAAAGAQPLAPTPDPTGGDPLGSMQWPSLARTHMAGAPWRWSEHVRVQGPTFADDALNVPLSVDARALAHHAGPVVLIRLVADRNPIAHILDFEPTGCLPVLALRCRMEQSSAVRALVRTADGTWHVGHTQVQATGGGCTVPGLTRADGSWPQTLGQVQARLFRNPLTASNRLRLRVMHPMDTGLVAGIPAFHIDTLQLHTAQGLPVWRLRLREPVAENPLLTFELGPTAPGPWRLSGHDNNGNRIAAQVAA